MNNAVKFLTPLVPSLLILASCGGSSATSSNTSSLNNQSSKQDVFTSQSSEGSSSSETKKTSEDSSSSSHSNSSKEEKHTVFVVGDSTVCDFPDETTYYRRYGYGTQLDKYLNTTNLAINNLALSGRSSKSFISENNYQTLTSSIKAGDFLVVGFGHNDEKAEESRYTNPNGDYKTEGSFAYYLYTYYVKLALDADAYPILCTPICRYSSSGDYSGSAAHITKDSGTYVGGDYSAAIKTLGTALQVPVIDLTSETKSLYSSKDFTDDDVQHLFAWSTPTAMYDSTHTSIWGARYNAYFVAKGLGSTTSPLKGYVKEGISAPTRAVDLLVNPDYIEASGGDGSFTASTLYTTVKDPWYGTAMGAIGGNPSASNLSAVGNIIETDAANIEVIAGNPDQNINKGGKISNSTDGFVMAFQSKDLDNDYLFSAKMTIKALPHDGSVASELNQAGFGLMIRGDISIDTKANVATNYAAAGYYYSSSGAALNAPFARASASELTKGTDSVDVSEIEENKTIGISIKKFNTMADGTADYLCVVGTHSSTFTVNIKSGESNKMFLGCWSSRIADVSFSDISIVNQN